MTGPQTSSDPLWDGATVLYWGVADLVAGSGIQAGYFMNRHANDDVDSGNFRGQDNERCRRDHNGRYLEVLWRNRGLSGITGNGTYQGRITSPTEVQTSWEGNYELR